MKSSRVARAAGAPDCDGAKCLDFDYRFDFDGGAEGQGGHAKGGTGVLALLAQNGDEQVGAAIGNQMLLGEVGCGRHQNRNLDDTLDILKRDAGCVNDLGEDVERRQFSGVATLDDVHGIAEQSGDHALIVGRDLAGDVEQITAARDRYIAGHGYLGGGQFIAVLAEFFDWAGHLVLPSVWSSSGSAGGAGRNL